MKSGRDKRCSLCGKHHECIIGNYYQPACDCGKYRETLNRWRWAIYNLTAEEEKRITEMKWSLYKEPFTGTIHIIGKNNETVLTDPTEEELKLMIDFCYTFGYHKGRGFNPITLTANSATSLKQPIM